MVRNREVLIVELQVAKAKMQKKLDQSTNKRVGKERRKTPIMGSNNNWDLKLL